MITPIEHKDGVVKIPTGSGLGVEIDTEALGRFNAE